LTLFRHDAASGLWPILASWVIWIRNEMLSLSVITRLEFLISHPLKEYHEVGRSRPAGFKFRVVGKDAAEQLTAFWDTEPIRSHTSLLKVLLLDGLGQRLHPVEQLVQLGLLVELVEFGPNVVIAELETSALSVANDGGAAFTLFVTSNRVSA
jgi:hypothetical protein